MNFKLKALGLGLLATLALGAFAGVNATANSEGHFVAPGTPHAEVNQISGGDPQHGFEVTLHGLEGGVVCDKAIARGTISTETVTQVEGFTELEKCHTTGSESAIVVKMNECKGIGRVAKGTTSSTEQTEELVCPAGKAIVVEHPSCTYTIPPQKNNTGWTYTPIKDNGKDAITLDVNIQYTIQFHAGICVFLGTTHTATAKGSTIVRGINTIGEQINITAT
jgi:hypothetical protein